MPVTFGTVEVLPQPASAAPAPAASPSRSAPASDADDLAALLRQRHEREARVRAH